MATTVNVDKLADAVMSELKTYAALSTLEVEEAIKSVAKETAKDLQQTSPVLTGAYAKSWSSDSKPDAGSGAGCMVVYNKAPNYRVAHLLEFGHATVNGGFVSPRPHIKAAETKAGERLEEQLTRKLGGG